MKKKVYQIRMGNSFKLDAIHTCLTNHRGCHVEDIMDWDNSHSNCYIYGCIIVNNETSEIEAVVRMLGDDGRVVAYQLQMISLNGSTGYRRIYNKVISLDNFPDKIVRKLLLENI